MHHIDHDAVEIIIATFFTQIRVQEGLKKLGQKHMAEQLKEDLVNFAEGYGYEECKACGLFKHGCSRDRYDDLTCCECQKKDGTACPQHPEYDEYEAHKSFLTE